MNPDFFVPPSEGCEAYQWQLSELADSGAPPPVELLAHLASCAACRQFADRWLAGPPAALARPPAELPDERLRERILAAGAPSNVVPFAPSVRPRFPWTPWIGRIAACLALGGLAFWLLNPVASSVRVAPSGATGPTLTRDLVQMESNAKNEQKVLQTALVDGTRQVGGTVAWSVSALEL